MLYQQISCQIKSITPKKIIVIPERFYDPETQRFSGDEVCSLTNMNSAIKRGADIGHLSLKDHFKELTPENVMNIQLEGSQFTGQKLGWGSAIKSKGQVEFSLNQPAQDLWEDWTQISDNVFDLGKLELFNTQTRGFCEYKNLRVRTLKEGTKVRINGKSLTLEEAKALYDQGKLNGVTMGASDGHGFAVGLSSQLRKIRASRFTPVTMPVNMLSHLKGGTQEHVDELTSGLKKKSQRIRSKRLMAQRGSYESFQEAYLLSQAGRPQEERHMLFSASNTVERFKETLVEGMAEGKLLKGKTNALLSLTTFKDRLVNTVAGEEFRTSLTGGAQGLTRVLVPVYDVPVGHIGFSDKISDLKFIGVRQPVVTARNLFALISQYIQLPRYVSQYRAQIRKDGQLVGCAKGIFSEVESCEILQDDGTWEEVNEPCLLIGEKDAAMGIQPNGIYQVELNITNRWRNLAGINPEYLNADASIDFDGDFIQVYQVVKKDQELSYLWDLVNINYHECVHTHKKSPKTSVPWTDDWVEDMLYHLEFALDIGELMGIYSNTLELLSMFEGAMADKMAHQLLKDSTSAELSNISRYGYQTCMDGRKRRPDDPEEVRDIGRKISGQFWKIENRGPIKADPLKFDQGWFSSFEPKKSLLARRFEGVREDYLPAKIIAFAMQRDKKGQLKNWSKFSKSDPCPDYRFQDVLPEKLWQPDTMVKSWTLGLMREVVAQSKKVGSTGYKSRDIKGKEIIKYDLLSFVQNKRDRQIKNLVVDVAIMRDEADLVYLTPEGEVHTNHRVNRPDWVWTRVTGLERAAQEVMLTAFFLDNTRRAPRDNRDFTVTYMQPEICQYLHK